MKITYKTNSEVYDLLAGMEDRTPTENATLAYVEKFLKYGRDTDISQLYADIGKVHRFSREVITKIIDIKPATPEELIAILNSYNINVDNKVLDSILDILKGL